MEIQTSQMNYDERFKPKRSRRLYILAGIVLMAFFLGWHLGSSNYHISGGSGLGVFIERNRENAPGDVNWQILWDAIAQIDKKYVDRPINMQEILYGAVAGAVSALNDPYSVFLQPTEAQEFLDELAGNLEGIGAEIAIRNEILTVVAPLEGTPAERAGIRAGDYISKIDGLDTASMSIDEAVGRIRGPEGSRVVLTIFHRGATESVDMEITRAKIIVQSTTSEIRIVDGRRIGHIKIRRFADDTGKALDGIASEFLRQNVSGIILDLRNNPGGYLQTAVDISGNWVSSGQVVVTQQFGDGTKEVFRSSGSARLRDIKTVVLVNGGSASASEILAGALRDHNIAILVGEQTFGKGSIQELIDLPGGSDLKLTIAKWLTPSGHDLNREGLGPDIEVELSIEDMNNERDPQLEEALRIVGAN